MQKILVLLLLAVLAIGVYFVIKNLGPIPNLKPNSRTFDSNEVQFVYPSSYTTEPGPQSNLVMNSFGIDSNIGYGVAKTTNTKTGHFRLESIFTISRTRFINESDNIDNTESQCYVQGTDSRFNFEDSVMIDNINFKKSQQYSGAGAGNRYTQQSFRTYHNNYCWDVTLTDHSSSDYNGVDMNEVKKLEDNSWGELNQILSTFKFTN